jgi:hypothetical protein
MEVMWKKIKEKKGILIAFDKSMQPLLLWWYKCLRKYSLLPIAFVSLGVSKKVEKWCKNHGYFIQDEKFISYLKKVPVLDEYKKKWFGLIKTDVEQIRPYWFAKPIAMMHTPFEKTLYLDIDCEVLYPLDEIFAYLNDSEIVLCKDMSEINFFKKSSEILFSSGVIVYKNKSRIISKWAKKALEYNCEFLGDQDLLSRIIHVYKYNLKILEMFWNWPVVLGKNKEVKIYHWSGNKKIKLLEKIQEDKELLEEIKELIS